MKTKRANIPLLFATTLFIFTACSDSGNDGPAAVEAKIASDIAANVNTIFAPAEPDKDVEGDTESSPGYTFYDLETGSTISDSLSSDWDIAFGGTTILANSGNGGGIQLLQTPYADVETAPETGFEASNNTWYTYTGEAPNGPKHAVLANENETLVVKTPDGKYAKVQILSYYEGNPDTSTPEFASFMTRPSSKYFTFNYTIQNDGSTKLFHEDTITYFDFTTGEIIEDASSSQWDIGLQGTSIFGNIENGGGLQALNIDFSAVTEAPIEGYVGTNKTWYTYTANNVPVFAILPIEGITLVFKTADDEYAKVRIISYYQGNPDVTSQEFINPDTRSASRYYTFEYAIQADGSRFFE